MLSALHTILYRIPVIVIFFLLSVFTYGQSAVPPYEIRDDSTWQLVVPEVHVLHYFDKTGKLDLNGARALAAQGSFEKWDTSEAKKFEVRENHWFHYRVTNATGKRLESAFDSYASVSYFHIIRSNGQVETLTTGTDQSWKYKTEFFNANISPFWLAAGETVDVFYHARFVNSRFLDGNFKVALANPDPYARRMLVTYEPRYHQNLTNQTFLSGLILLATFIYFLFYSLVREKVFLFFALFLFGQGLGRSHYIQLLFRYYPETQEAINFLGSSTFIFFLLFFREYLNTKKYQPRWDKLLVALAAAVGIAIFYIEFFRSEQFDSTGTLLLAAIVVVMLITFFLLGAEQEKEKKFLLYAILPALIGFLLLVSFSFIVEVFISYDTPYVQQINYTWNFLGRLLDLSLLWMILSFSRLLFRRFSEQRQRIREQELEKEQILQRQELERLNLIEQQKKELEAQVAERTAELKRSIEDLKSTQAQLIQSEKMASLGEMTAGIAHEIQNPLNFVNNFAEVNAELADEINEEIRSSVQDPAQREKLALLLNDMKANQAKIREHGKRADSIVKNMLQHSRTASEKKEPVNFNALVDEYVKLSYHGFRGRDKSFNANFQTELDPAIDTAELLPQDFGRVVLNLVNNAFYAVRDKARTAGEDFRPAVQIKTEKENGMVNLTVSDNGNGIPDSLREKILQPFFTTKPAGEGTGLGLSISYDIITKGHGGTMRVESTEGKGTSFIVSIPA